MTDAEIKAEIRKFITRGHSREDVLIELAFKYAPSFEGIEEEYGCDGGKEALQAYSSAVFMTAAGLWRLVA